MQDNTIRTFLFKNRINLKDYITNLPAHSLLIARDELQQTSNKSYPHTCDSANVQSAHSYKAELTAQKRAKERL